MDLQDLVAAGHRIEVIIQGTGWKLEETIAAVVATEDWDFLGRLLVSAAEISARQMVDALLAREAFVPLAIGACMRRQPRRPGEGATGGGGGGLAARVFRDINAEDDAKGVPDYIRADLEEMSSAASASRSASMARDAEMDRDPTRQYIIDKLAERLRNSPEALDAMVAIARASAWEETRRTAALKIANDPIAVARLGRDLRSEDIVEIARVAVLAAVAETFAKEMGKHFQGYMDAKDAAGLRFIGEHHPDEKYRASAVQWADAIEKETGTG